MELNFTEMNNAQNPYENYDNNSYQNENIDSQKYWEPNATQNKNLQPKKKKVTFTDILSNMNLVVNNQGVLQFMAPVNQVEEQQQPYQQPYQQPQQQQEPLDPSVKHSYIFNKYFKDYRDINKPKEVKVPKTKEEYIQMVIEERTRQIQERKRIAQIKSKKMMFTTNYTHTSNTINASTNGLRKMSFH
jgi:hypothetical protein